LIYRLGNDDARSFSRSVCYQSPLSGCCACSLHVYMCVWGACHLISCAAIKTHTMKEKEREGTARGMQNKTI